MDASAQVCFFGHRPQQASPSLLQIFFGLLLIFFKDASFSSDRHSELFRFRPFNSGARFSRLLCCLVQIRSTFFSLATTLF